MSKKSIQRWDTLGKVTFDATRTAEGFLEARAPITKCGVFAYEQKDGTILRELRHPDDVYSAAALKTMEMMPVQIGHVAMLTPDNSKALQVGQVGNNIEVDAPYVYGNLRITAREGIAAVTEQGQDGLSCGYFCDVVMESGVYKGEQYDARQINIRYNHLALCTIPRLGEELRISLDSAGAFQTDRKPRVDSTSQQENPMSMKVTLDNGISYDAVPEVAAEMKRLKDELARVKGDAATAATTAANTLASSKQEMQKVIDTEKGRADGLQDKVTKLEEEAKKLPAQIADGIRRRAGLVKVAEKVLPEAEVTKLDSMSEMDIKKAVILARNPKAKMDEKASEDYITSRFDSIVEAMDEEDADAGIAAQRAAAAPRHDGRLPVEGQDAARARMVENLKNGNKVVAAK